MAARQVLIDTNAYAAFKRNVPDAVEIIKHVPFLCINSIVLGELFGGFAAGTHEADNKQELKRFLDSDRVRMLFIDDKTAEYYAIVYWNLRRKGRPIPTNDMWIAATALQHGLLLFSYDGHFKAVDGVVVVNRLSDFAF
ncbi:MAG: type II toxin-antitoxin system VapC family toxin [Pyrinomonadaceae bacterium]